MTTAVTTKSVNQARVHLEAAFELLAKLDHSATYAFTDATRARLAAAARDLAHFSNVAESMLERA